MLNSAIYVYERDVRGFKLVKTFSYHFGSIVGSGWTVTIRTSYLIPLNYSYVNMRLSQYKMRKSQVLKVSWT